MNIIERANLQLRSERAVVTQVWCFILEDIVPEFDVHQYFSTYKHHRDLYVKIFYKNTVFCTLHPTVSGVKISAINDKVDRWFSQSAANDIQEYLVDRLVDLMIRE